MGFDPDINKHNKRTKLNEGGEYSQQGERGEEFDMAKRIPRKYRKILGTSKKYGKRSFKRRTFKRRKLRFRRKLYKRRYGRRFRRGRGGKTKNIKSLALKILSISQPWKVYKKVTRSGFSSVHGQIAIKSFTIGTFKKELTAAGTFDDGINETTNSYVKFNSDATYSYTDLAWAREAYYASDATIQNRGRRGYIHSNTKYINLKNNANVRVHITATWFKPRRGSSNNMLHNTKTMLEIARVDSNFSIATPGSDYRNCSNIAVNYKLIVKKFSLQPGESKWLTLKMGGTPFRGYNTFFDDNVATKRFTRGLQLLGYGDPIFDDAAATAQTTSTAPVNVSVMVIQRMKGKVTHMNNYQEWYDISDGVPVLTTPLVVPLGSNQHVTPKGI